MSCYGCTKRHMYCHVSCEEYKRERAERDALNEKIRAEKEKEQIAVGFEIEGARKRQKASGRTWTK